MDRIYLLKVFDFICEVDHGFYDLIITLYSILRTREDILKKCAAIFKLVAFHTDTHNYGDLTCDEYIELNTRFQDALALRAQADRLNTHLLRIFDEGLVERYERIHSLKKHCIEEYGMTGSLDFLTQSAMSSGSDQMRAMLKRICQVSDNINVLRLRTEELI